MYAKLDGRTLVCRALRAVADGALDDETEASLAAELGVSVRHLRRLFSSHLGTTPTRLATVIRAHRARRLLDEAGLRITDVAFAAGFQSVRQFNRVMKQRFNATPREIRTRRLAATR